MFVEVNYKRQNNLTGHYSTIMQIVLGSVDRYKVQYPPARTEVIVGDSLKVGKNG